MEYLCAVSSHKNGGRPAEPYTLKKSLGQHFLHDEDQCQRIVSEVERRPGLNLLEIGPGGGAITKYMLQWPEVVYHAIEIDLEKVAYLQRQYPGIVGNITEGDILQARKPFDTRFSVIGNFPYNISTQILFRILEWEPDIDEVVGMFQKEVAWRVASGPGSKDYGILSVLMQAYFDVEYRFDVPPEAFTPPPKVVSGVLRARNNGNPHGIQDKRVFMRLVKAAFSQRRKTLRNALKGTLSPEALAEHPLMGQRAEQLSVAEFAGLYHQYMAPKA